MIFAQRLLLSLLLGCALLSGAVHAQEDDPAVDTSEAKASAVDTSEAKASAVEASAVEAPSAEAAPEVGEVIEGVPEMLASQEVLDERFIKWLQEVKPLILQREKNFFHSLTQDYQRDAFIEEFWRVRDPYPRTARNELKERWPERLAFARAEFGDLDDDRTPVYLIHGKAPGKLRVRCSERYTGAEVWAYQGTDQARFPFAVVFIRPSQSAPMRIWRPGYTGALEQVASRLRGCINGGQLVEIISQLRSDDGYSGRIARALAKPRPNSLEWVDAFVAFTTDVPPGAPALDVETEIQFPGRYQLRTVVQGLLSVSVEKLGTAEFAGYRSYDFQLTGEVLREDGALFDRFRYKYGFPVGEGVEDAISTDTIPIAFQRYLRPGDYTLVLRLDDLNSEHAIRLEQPLQVPVGEGASAPTVFRDPRAEGLFAEAAEALARGETAISIVPPSRELLTGFVRFDTLSAGDISKVRFYLDDQLVLTKNKPPFNVSIDLGEYPDLHALRAEALNGEGVRVASDELLVNGGGYRFLAKIVEPRRGERYSGTLQAKVEVEVPDGRTLDRLEFYLNEVLVATLYQPPFVQPIVLPDGEQINFVRTVAYLPDGNSTEDLVFINAPEYLEEVEVQFVELYTSVLDRHGRPVEGLKASDFKILEDGKKQELARFELVEDQPIHVGILIDNSASMRGTLEEVRRAALSFFRQAIRPKDRAAVITFNSFPSLEVELTNDRAALGGGLAGLVPEGQTALYDSVMFALYYFTGIRGQRAILVLSDGKDEASRFEFDETLEYARRAGVKIYSIGFRLNDSGARNRLRRLADETGGQSFFLNEITELETVYALIQRELRSQYLIAYQSKNTSEERIFRRVELDVDRPDITVKTLSGYYP